MPELPPREEQTPRSCHRLRLILLSKPMMGMLLVLGAGLGLAGWWAFHFIHKRLAPQIAESLSESLQRPVEVGQLERLSLSGLRFGPSAVPPHRHQVNGRTLVDKDQGRVEAVEVQFDLWKTLWTRSLTLDITLVKVQAYLDRRSDGSWLNTTWTSEDQDSGLAIKLDSLSIKGGEVVVDPRNTDIRTLSDVEGVVFFKEDNQRFDFKGKGTLDSGGKAQLEGKWMQPSQALQLKLRAKQLNAPPLMVFLPEDIPLQVQSGEVDGEFELQYKPRLPLKLSAIAQVQRADIRLPEQNIRVKAKQVQGDLAVTYVQDQIPQVEGDAQFQAADFSVPEDLIFQNGRSRRQQLRRTQGSLKFLPKERRVQFEARGAVASGGRLRTRGDTKLDLTQMKILLLAQNISAPILDRAFQTPITIRSGRVDTNLTVLLDQTTPPNMRGTVRLKDIDAQLVGVPKSFNDANGYVRLRGLTASLEGITTRYDQVPLRAQGSIDLEQGYNLSVQIPEVDVNTALATLEVPALPVPLSGQVQVPNLRITGAIPRPLMAGEVAMTPGSTIDRVPFKEITAQFILDNPTLKVTDLLALPQAGGEITGTARNHLVPGAELVADIDIKGVSADAIATLYDASPGITIGPITAQTQVRGQTEDLRTLITFQAPQATYPTTGKLRLRSGRTYLDNVVAQVAGGTARLDGFFDQEKFQAQAKLAGIGLSEFSPDLQGLLQGTVDLQAPLANLSPETLRAQGQVNFSQGLSLIAQPLATQFRWTGRQIVVQSASAKGFEAQGILDADLQTPQGPQVTGLNLTINAEDYDLRTLAALGPTKVPLTGQADLRGQLTGSLDSPQLIAALQLKDLAVSQFRFEPVMAGKLNFGQGVDLRLGGNRDRIQVTLNSDFLPQSFLIRRDQALATGTTQGDLLQIEAQQIPLRGFNLSPIPNSELGPIAGMAAAQFTANLKHQSLVGSFAIDEPGLKPFQANRLTGEIHYQDGIARLQQAKLQKDQSQYVLDAQFIPGQDPQYSGQLAILQGNITDVATLAQTLDFASLEPSPLEPNGTAADLETLPVGVKGPLLTQLQRFAEIRQLAILKENEKEQPLFDVDGLTGEFGGQIAFSGSMQTGINADFDLRGQDFNLGVFGLDKLMMKGKFADGLLALDPLRIQKNDSLLAFQGQIGSTDQSGTLQLQNISLEPLNPLLELPVQVTGKLNGQMDLGGTVDNPQFDGQFDLVDGRLDNAVVNSAQATLNYQQAILSIDSQARINSQPLSLKGTVPYAPDFSSVTPASDQIALTASIQDDGLSLLSLLTDQVVWEGGQGTVAVDVKGTINQPIVNGTLRFNQARIQAAALKKPLTDLTGTIEFNRNLVTIPRLTANIDQGTLAVTGSLPMFQPSSSQSLAVNLRDLDLQVQELYQGGVNGSLNIRGSALQPQVAGKLQLSDGTVKLANSEASPQPGAGTTTAIASDPATDNPLKFSDLVVQIQKNVKISQPPVLSFIATGDLTVNGSIGEPIVDGLVRFQKGSINLVTTLFSVDSRRENYAKFDSRFGLDPYLNIGMGTTVTEVVQATTTELNEFEEVPSSAISAVQSVKIKAAVDGRVSELVQDFGKVVTLSSRPNRSNGKIITLLGGGIDRSLQGGQATQAIANIGSSAAFSSVQQSLNNTLGNRASFRAFPVLLPNQSQNRSSVLAFGVELGYDITNRFSASVLQLLTGVDEPTLFNLSYDINDQLRTRSSVSSEGEAVGILEYRVRF